MKITHLTVVVAICTVTGIAAARAQAPDDERRAGITVMRAINTAENAARRTGGKYVPLAELVNHPMMGGVKANLAVNGEAITHQGSQLRLALSVDGMGYQAMVVPTQTCGTAVFSDERGFIYTGKVLDC